MLVYNDQVNAAAGAIVPLRPLTVASAYRRMDPRRRSPGAHEDANAESVYLLICTWAGVGGSARACVRARGGEGGKVAVAVLFALSDSGGAQAGGGGGGECERIKLRTAALPSSALHRLCPLAAVAVLFVL